MGSLRTGHNWLILWTLFSLFKKGIWRILVDTPDVLICFVSQNFKAHSFCSNTGIIYFVIINPVVLKAQHSRIARRWNDQAKKLIREKIKFQRYVSKYGSIICLSVAHIFQLIKFGCAKYKTQEQRTARNVTTNSLELKLNLLLTAAPGGSSPSCFWSLSQPRPLSQSLFLLPPALTGGTRPSTPVPAKVNSKNDHKLMVYVP